MTQVRFGFFKVGWKKTLHLIQRSSSFRTFIFAVSFALLFIGASFGITFLKIYYLSPNQSQDMFQEQNQYDFFAGWPNPSLVNITISISEAQYNEALHYPRPQKGFDFQNRYSIDNLSALCEYGNLSPIITQINNAELSKRGDYYDQYELCRRIISFVTLDDTPCSMQGNNYSLAYLKTPLETLATRGGDYADLSILLCALMREAGYDSILIQTNDTLYPAVCPLPALEYPISHMGSFEEETLIMDIEMENMSESIIALNYFSFEEMDVIQAGYLQEYQEAIFLGFIYKGNLYHPIDLIRQGEYNRVFPPKLFFSTIYDWVHIPSKVLGGL